MSSATTANEAIASPTNVLQSASTGAATPQTAASANNNNSNNAKAKRSASSRGAIDSSSAVAGVLMTMLSGNNSGSAGTASGEGRPQQHSRGTARTRAAGMTASGTDDDDDFAMSSAQRSSDSAEEAEIVVVSRSRHRLHSTSYTAKSSASLAPGAAAAAAAQQPTGAPSSSTVPKDALEAMFASIAHANRTASGSGVAVVSAATTMAAAGVSATSAAALPIGGDGGGLLGGVLSDAVSAGGALRLDMMASAIDFDLLSGESAAGRAAGIGELELAIEALHLDAPSVEHAPAMPASAVSGGKGAATPARLRHHAPSSFPRPAKPAPSPLASNALISGAASSVSSYDGGASSSQSPPRARFTPLSPRKLGRDEVRRIAHMSLDDLVTLLQRAVRDEEGSDRGEDTSPASQESDPK